MMQELFYIHRAILPGEKKARIINPGPHIVFVFSLPVLYLINIICRVSVCDSACRR